MKIWVSGAIGAALSAAVPAIADDGTSMAALRKAEAAVAKPTLVERFGPDDSRSGTLRVPAGKGPFPVAVLIHGGCWTKGFDTRSGFEPLAAALAARGIAVWNIEYRMVGQDGAGWPGTFQDVVAGFDYLPKLAKRYRFDLSRVTIVGHSAGAHLALWLASRPKLGAPWTTGAVKPVSVVAIDGPATLAPFVGIDTQVCGKPVIVPFMGGTPAEKPDAYRAASPADHLPLGLHQLLVLGELGPLMKPYVAGAKASGDRVDVLAPDGADHFDIIVPGTANGAKVVDFIAANAFVK